MLTNFFGFHTIKSILALLGADWGCQTLHQAQTKNRDWHSRLQHVAIVAAVQGLSARTANVSWNQWTLFVAINALSHYLIDSYRINKAIDQSLHLTIAIITAPLLIQPAHAKTRNS